MKEKAEQGYVNPKDNILNQDSAIFIRILVFLYMFMSTSAQTRECSVVRSRYGDRIVFFNYTGTCNKEVNPCRQLNSVWNVSSMKNCYCQCSRQNCAYREDLKTCVKNEESRDGCSLLFHGERSTYTLRVFSKSTAIRLYTLPRENCVVKGTSYVTANSTVTWEQFSGYRQTFYIWHRGQNKNKHAHFLKWIKGKPAVELFGKIVKVSVQCRVTSGRGRDALKDLCIVFKVSGSISVPCLVSKPSSPTLMTTLSRTSTTELSNQITNKSGIITDVATVTLGSPHTTTEPSVNNQGNRESQDVGKGGLPIWLIAVVAGGAVIATLFITAIIWICWKMKKRSQRKRNRSRARLGNSLYNQEDDAIITFAPSEAGPAIDEAGYAKVGSPIRKGYAVLKPASDRSRSEYQKLIKPNEDKCGYLLPLEEVKAANNQSDSDIYSEPQSPKPPQNKPKSKEYDYAKPEGIIVLTASRTSLDNLDSKKHDSEPNEAHYVETRELDPPSSPVYTNVMGPNSPTSPGGSSEGPSQDNECNDSPHPDDYIEVLPDTENTT